MYRKIKGENHRGLSVFTEGKIRSELVNYALKIYVANKSGRKLRKKLILVVERQKVYFKSNLSLEERKIQSIIRLDIKLRRKNIIHGHW